MEHIEPEFRASAPIEPKHATIAVPRLEFPDGGAWSMLFSTEPDPERLKDGPVQIWRAWRGNDSWALDWSDTDGRLRLMSSQAGEVWGSYCRRNGPVTDMPELKAISDQFRANSMAAHASAKIGGQPVLDWVHKRRGATVAAPSTGSGGIQVAPAASGNGWAWRLSLKAGRIVLMLMGALLILTMVVQHMRGSVVPSAAASAVSPVAAASPLQKDRSLSDQLTPTEMRVVANATRSLGIQMKPSGQPFVIFSDPNCPVCKDLESKLAKVDPRFAPIIVPVAFKPNSEEAVRKIICAKDPIGAWSAAIGGTTPTGDAVSDGNCDDAANRVTASNGAFVALNFSGTPTLVSATGKVVSGSGSVEQIDQWLSANGGLKPVAASAH